MRFTVQLLILIIANVKAISIRGGKTIEENTNEIETTNDKKLKKIAIECVVQGWEKPDCLEAEGCQWCDTEDFGGACVTDAFASHVKDFSYFSCVANEKDGASTSQDETPLTSV